MKNQDEMKEAVIRAWTAGLSDDQVAWYCISDGEPWNSNGSDMDKQWLSDDQLDAVWEEEKRRYPEGVIDHTHFLQKENQEAQPSLDY